MKEYKNPKPIAVAVVPAFDPVRNVEGVLVIRRAGGGQFNGMLALPAGYMELGETWKESVVRELREETGIEADAEDVRLLDVMTSPLNGNLQVFGSIITMPVDISMLKPTPEASEFLVIGRGDNFETEFSTHKAAVEKYFDLRVDFLVQVLAKNRLEKEG